METTSNSKKILFWIMSVLIIFLSIIGVTFALFNYSLEGSKSTSIKSGSISVNYQEGNNGVNLVDAEPISDTAALNDENAYTFSINYTNDGDNYLSYSIYFENYTSKLDEVINGEVNSLPTNKIKIGLYDVDDNKFVINPTYFSNLENDLSNLGYNVYQNTVLGSGIKNYKLYLWIPETDSDGNPITILGTSSDTSISNSTFSLIVNVKSNYSNE